MDQSSNPNNPAFSRRRLFVFQYDYERRLLSDVHVYHVKRLFHSYTLMKYYFKRKLKSRDTEIVLALVDLNLDRCSELYTVIFL